MRIRHADLGDIVALTDMAARFMADSHYGTLFPTTRPQLEHVVLEVLKHGVVLVAALPPHEPECDDGDLVGMLGLIAGPHPFSGALIAEEIAWWVAPAHRRGRVGPLLLAEGERWAYQHGAAQLKMVAPGGAAGVGVGRFLERCGYAAVETAFLKPLR